MNNVKVKEINILPDRSLMPKLGQTGYSVSQAIAELVDNSIDAREDGRLLTIEISLSPDKDFVKVTDDGTGMDEKTAGGSMRLAHSMKVDQLGEFGLGMKTSATSLGKSFEIITTQKDSSEEYFLEWDEAKWLKDGDWNKHIIKIKEGVGKKRSGTTILVKQLRFKVYPNLPGRIKKDLSERFAPYIENGDVRIKVNTKWCKPEPLELNESYHPKDGKEPFKFDLESGNTVWGWRGLLKKGSDKGEYGFRVFRRGRLIMQYAKLGFNPHPEARQIVGEIHLDHVPVTHNKREFIQESPLYKEMADEDTIFWNYMRDLVREARSSMRKKQISQGVQDKMDLQKDNILKAIKKLPELKEYAFPDLKEKLRGTRDNHDDVDEIEIERRDPREMVSIEDNKEGSNPKDRNAKKTRTKRTYFITVNGKKFRVDHSFVDLKTDYVLKDKSVDEKTGIQVFTNTAFPAFANTKDHVFYGTWHIAEAIAEVMVELNDRPAEEVQQIRDKILSKSAEITRDLDGVEKDKIIAEKLEKELKTTRKKIERIEKEHADIDVS